jgi:hypothetical protein
MVLNFSGAVRWPGFAPTRANIADSGAAADITLRHCHLCGRQPALVA